MPAKQKVFGPYRVKNIGVGGDVYEVVEMVDNHSNTWEELRPRKTYLNRQSAYGKCLRLNKRWQEDHALDDEMLEYWEKAEN
jgi:hypothetical protein